MLEQVTAWEWEDPGLGAMHFLIVASFNLQHPSAFTEDALARLSSAFVEHLDHGLPVASIRSRHATAFGGETRVLKPVAERTTLLRTWPMTVADAYAGGPAGAVERVRQWIRAVRSAL